MAKLNKYLEAAKLGQAVFSESIGVTQATVSRLARGKMVPSLELALAIEVVTNGAVPVSSWVTPQPANPSSDIIQEAS
ncbi:hypothetical protein JI58_07875 [Marinosulfonomonas sp. PRT-SC04]|nr:hypothetical protein JI58_07875 [Marinosulfonomonas sp. PRT-SC04]